ncbi:pyrimidine reductase family protein [Microbacterium invictum]
MPARTGLRAAYALPDRATPRIRMNFVESLDGAVTLAGRSGGLGGQTDRVLMQVLRAMADVVLIGAGTVRAEGYGGIRVAGDDAAWRLENGLSPQPRLAVVSHDLDLDPGHPVFADAESRPLLITHAGAPPGRREELSHVADVVVAGAASVDLIEMRDELARRGMPQILCEGGPHLFGSLLDAGVVDEVCVTLAPRLIGGRAGRIVQGAGEADRHGQLAGVLTDDEGYVFLRYRTR